MRAALQRRGAAGEAGYTVIEMLVVMSILGVVVGGLTTVFVRGANAEIDMNRRFQAQTDARVALDKLRRDVHCANAITPAGVSTSTVTLTLPVQCKSGTGNITWCTQGSGTNYGLYRVTGSTCSGGVKYASYVTQANLFNYTAQSTTSLGKLHIDLPVNTKPSNPLQGYRLIDDIVLRNTTRAAPTP